MKACSIPEWRPLSVLYRSYKHVTWRRQALFQNRSLSGTCIASMYMSFRESISLSCTASMYMSYREGRLHSGMEASLFPIQLLYPSHIEKAAMFCNRPASKHNNKDNAKPILLQWPSLQNKTKKCKTR